MIFIILSQSNFFFCYPYWVCVVQSSRCVDALEIFYLKQSHSCLWSTWVEIELRDLQREGEIYKERERYRDREIDRKKHKQTNTESERERESEERE